MYVDLLASALDEWEDDLTGEALVDYVLTCRNEMLTTVPRRGKSAYVALAAEIAYDRALIKLCSAHGIDAEPADFAHPSDERAELERALVDAGIDLAVLARRHHL